MTVKEALDYVIERAREEGQRSTGPACREFALAATAAEDAQIRFTRGLAHQQGKFKPADLEA